MHCRPAHIFFVLAAALLLNAQVLQAATIFSGIGNDGYVHDAEGIFDALKSSSAHIDLSASSVNKDLSGTAIASGIYGLSHVIGNRDSLIWFYSGHAGFKADGTDMDETAAGSFAHDSYDETIGILSDEQDKLRDDALAEAFLSLSDSVQNIVVVMDVCYAGGFIGGTLDLNRVPSITFLGSSREEEKSYSYNDQPYSVFTSGLIKGLSGFEADSNGDGLLMASEWYEYAASYTEANVNNQHPVFYGDDTVIASIAIPLPGAFSLLGAGILLLAIVKRRYYRKS